MVQGCAIQFDLCVSAPLGGGTGDGTLDPFLGKATIGAGEEFRFNTNVSTLRMTADFEPTAMGANLTLAISWPTQVVPLTLSTNRGWYFTFLDPNIDVTLENVTFGSNPLLVSLVNIDSGPKHLAVEFDPFTSQILSPSKTAFLALTAVPEPATGSLFAYGIGALCLASRRERSS